MKFTLILNTLLHSFIYLMIFCGLSSTSYAQTKTFYDDFKDNQSGWPLKDTEEGTFAIEDGYFVMSNKKEKGFSWRWFSGSVDPNQDFFLETSITEVSGTQKHGSGLYWGCSGTKNYYRFLITSKGYVEIGRFKSGKYNFIYKWKKHASVKLGFGKVNVLSIRKNSNNIRFLVNKQLIYSMPSKEFTRKYPFFGKFVGFITYNITKAKFDYFKYTRVSPEMNLIKNPKQGFKKEVLGDGVNSRYNDITPVLTPDSKTLYFIRTKDPRNIKVGKQDIWYSERKADGSWGNAKNLGRPVNSNFHNRMVSTSADGNTLIVGGIYNTDCSFL